MAATDKAKSVTSTLATVSLRQYLAARRPIGSTHLPVYVSTRNNLNGRVYPVIWLGLWLGQKRAMSSSLETGDGIEKRERQTDKQTGKGAERERERENSNSKTLILKDSSVRSIWTCLTASPC